MDGKSATAWGANSCTHTADEDKAWWIVDLGKGEHVTEVYIVNRDFRGDRLSNFEIRVGRLLFLISPATFIRPHVHVQDQFSIVIATTSCQKNQGNLQVCGFILTKYK